MNRYFKTLSLLAAIAFLAAACAPSAVNVAQAAPEEVSYRAMLGRPLSDQTVTDFIASNNCAPSGSFRGRCS